MLRRAAASFKLSLAPESLGKCDPQNGPVEKKWLKCPILHRGLCIRRLFRQNRYQFVADFWGFFGTVRRWSGGSEQSRDSVAVLAVRGQPVSPCKFGKCREIPPNCRESARFIPCRKSQHLNASYGSLPNLTSRKNLVHSRERADQGCPRCPT
jgi:hypothetical protein